MSAGIGHASESYWRVDPSADWYDPMGSHHLKHAELGVVVGYGTYAGASLAFESRAARYGSAIGAGIVVGFGYEIYHRSDTTLADPVDAAYVVAGSLVGAVLCDLTCQAIEAYLAPDAAAIGYTARW